MRRFSHVALTITWALCYVFTVCDVAVWLNSPQAVKLQTDRCGCSSQTCCASGKCCCAPSKSVEVEGPIFSQCDSDFVPRRMKQKAPPIVPCADVALRTYTHRSIIPWPDFISVLRARAWEPPDKIPIA